MRVYDIENKHWVVDDMYIPLNSNNELYILKKNIFKKKKLTSVDADKYVIHRDINLYDKNNKLIHEGDIVKAKVSNNRAIVGVVVYAYELASYVLLCDKTSEYFNLSFDYCQYIQVIGNVFDGYKELEQDD